MIILESKIAKKYALAFLRVNEKAEQQCSLETVENFSSFIAAHKLFIATLSIPSLPQATKRLIIEHATNKVGLCPLIQKLIFLLLQKKKN